MHVDVRKSSLWRTNLLRVRIRGKSLQRNEASKWVFFPNGWNPWHWGSLTLCWSLTPSCLSSTAGSGIEASLNIGFISSKLLPSHKQSLLLLEWGYIQLLLLNGDRHHHSTIVFFDIAFLELQCKLEMEIFCNWLPNVLADWLLSYILSTPTVGSWWRKGSVRRVMTSSQSLLPLMMKLVLALFCVSGDHKVVTALIDWLILFFVLVWFSWNWQNGYLQSVVVLVLLQLTEMVTPFKSISLEFSLWAHRWVVWKRERELDNLRFNGLIM